MQQLLHIKNTKHLSEERFTVESYESLYDDLTYSRAVELLKELKDDPYQGSVEMYLQVDESTDGILSDLQEDDLDEDICGSLHRKIEGTYNGIPFQAVIARLNYMRHPISRIKVTITEYAGDKSALKHELMDRACRLI